MQKQPPKQFLKVDEMIQRIILILIGLTLIIYPVAMLLAIPFGAWQVISGIVGIFYGSRWRMGYIFCVINYFVSIPLSFQLIEKRMVPEDALMVVYLVVPVILGIYYYYKTATEAPKKEQVESEDIEGILDAEIVMNKN